MLRNIIKYGSRCRAYNAEVHTSQSGLSISPAEMNECVRSGIPVASSMMSEELLSPGHRGSDDSVPIYRQRGIDFSDVFCAESSAREKIASASLIAPEIKND